MKMKKIKLFENFMIDSAEYVQIKNGVDDVQINGVSVKTGDSFTIDVYHGNGGGGSVDMPFGSIVPSARFYAFTREEAGNYGVKVENSTLKLENPFVLRNDVQLEELGISTAPGSLTFNRDLIYKKIEDLLNSHDGVVVIVSPLYDLDYVTGEASKMVKKIFGHTQAFIRRS